MKKIILSLILISPVVVCLAQKTKPVQSTSTNQTLSSAPNKYAGRLPDLTIVNATVTAEPTSHKLTIRCIIKNEGNAAITLDKIDIGGLYVAEGSLHLPLSNIAYRPGCGIAGGLERETLQPGASITREYSCFNFSIPKAEKPVYILFVDRGAYVKELNEENNKQNVYITYQ